MAKYLVCTKDKDIVMSKKSSKNLSKIFPNEDFLVYDKDGILLYEYSEYMDLGRIERYVGDGEPREWAKDFIKNHKVGEFDLDAEGKWWSKFKLIYPNTEDNNDKD